MLFIQNGRVVKWAASSLTSQPDPSVAFAIADDLEELLQHFSTLFAKPMGLPPERHRSHQIRLLSGTLPIVVRSYRYAHHQKQELERQCAAMLTQGVIRLSSSAFAAHVLLVKKADGLWRFCVNYRASNVKIVCHKFPIPVVEEFLDELCGATFFSKHDLRSGYHQVLMHCEDVEKTAFRTHEGLFKFLVCRSG
jgi:hypothetical protein